jgi:pyruvate dehydrogenase E2 component (dihydrolipoamide acetyltransferase)
MIDVRVPELSASTSDATLVAWRKNVGDVVHVGDVIAELETEKSTVDLEAEADGILAEILVAEGSEGIAVGTVIARLAEPGEAADSERAIAAGSPAPAVDDPLPTPVRAPEPPVPPVRSAPAIAADAIAISRAPASSVSATPLAARMAAQAQLDLARLEGSGERGRIVSLDVERALGVAREARAAPHAVGLEDREPPGAWDGATPGRDERLGAARRTAAERLAAAKRTAPHFYLDVECDAEPLLELRRTLNVDRTRASLPTVTVNDLLVSIVAHAFRRVPAANVAWRDGSLRWYERVDLAVAVASPRGLVTPVVREADQKGVSEIALLMRDLIERAQHGRLRPDEYSGGTATLSNLGMYGVRRLFPILNLPQACILGIGAVEERVVARNGAAVVGRTMVVTLSADHRALDGAVGAQLLSAFRLLVEQPLTMLL